MTMPHAHPDLRALIDSGTERWFLSAAIPAPSDLDDAEHRFDLQWKNARSQLSEKWPEEEVEELDQVMGILPHKAAVALYLVHPLGGPTLVEFLEDPVERQVVNEGAVPRFAPVIEARQRTLAHMVVEADRAGADLTAFDGGHVLDTETVDGDTEHIHRGHAGGWSQRRFQQRAENTWERNADTVVEAIVAMAKEVEPELIAVSGDVRAQTLILDALPHDLADRSVKIEAGSPEGIADEVVRCVADLVASRSAGVAEQLREQLAGGTGCVGVDDTLAALVEGRVDQLIVHDDQSDTPVTAADSLGAPAGSRVVDVAIAAALRSDADVIVVPKLAVLDGPIAALLRW